MSSKIYDLTLCIKSSPRIIVVHRNKKIPTIEKNRFGMPVVSKAIKTPNTTKNKTTNKQKAQYWVSFNDLM